MTQKNEIDIKKTKEELGFSKDSIVLLFFGYVRKYKGLDILIEAFPNILTEIPEARLLIVGEFYDKPDTYLEQIKNDYRFRTGGC